MNEPEDYPEAEPYSVTAAELAAAAQEDNDRALTSGDSNDGPNDR